MAVPGRIVAKPVIERRDGILTQQWKDGPKEDTSPEEDKVSSLKTLEEVVTEQRETPRENPAINVGIFVHPSACVQYVSLHFKYPCVAVLTNKWVLGTCVEVLERV